MKPNPEGYLKAISHFNATPEDTIIFEDSDVGIEAARKTKVEAGSALAVSREDFSQYITDVINSHENIEVIYGEVSEIDFNTPTIIATGPLTSNPLCEFIKEKFGLDDFYFFDAQAPIIKRDSIDMNIAYFKSRYDKGEAAYINCPMTEEQFSNFYNELIALVGRFEA